MKKIVALVLALTLVVAFVAACGEPAGTAPSGAASKIAIVTNTVDQNEEEFRSATVMIEKYGEDRIIHRTWPVNFTAEGEQMVTILRDIASDPEVGAIIINQAVINTNPAIDAVREMRGEDIFIASISAAENPDAVAERVNLALDVNNLILGKPIVEQAASMGAETFVHYSFPRHMGVPMLAARRDLMKETCEALGIEFVELETPDPTGDGGQAATQQHIMQDVPRQVEIYGPNTAFFGTNCAMQTPMQQQVLETGAIYPQPCCPSPYHAFPATLGITDSLPTGEFDEEGNEIMARRNISEVVAEITAAVADRGMTNRLSTWPVPAAMMWTTIATEYAMAWLNGEVPQDFGAIDVARLTTLSEDFIESLYGERFGADLQAFDLEGQKFDHYLLGTMGFLTF